MINKNLKLKKIENVSEFIENSRKTWVHKDGSRMICQENLDELIEISKEGDEWFEYDYNGGFCNTSGGYCLMRGDEELGSIMIRCS